MFGLFKKSQPQASAKPGARKPSGQKPAGQKPAGQKPPQSALKPGHESKDLFDIETAPVPAQPPSSRPALALVKNDIAAAAPSTHRPDGIAIPPAITPDEAIKNAKLGIYGDPLTTPSGVITTTAEQRENAILFDKGVMLVAKKTAELGIIASLKEMARTRYSDFGDFANIRTIEVPKADIATLYSEFERQATAKGRAPQGPTINQSGELQARFFSIAKEAIERGASDVHLIHGHRENSEAPARTRIELRIDRLLELYDVWSYEEGERLVQAAFNLTDVGSASKSTLPEGAFVSARISSAKNHLLDKRAFGLRMQFNSTAGADHEIVFRILYKQISADLIGLDTMGFAPKHLKLIGEAVRRPNVLNWISGMVNSGKSTTQRAILNEMNRNFGSRMKIATIENPVEFVLPFAIQHDVSNSTYLEILKAQLRSDRNAVSIGETRGADECSSAFELITTGMRGWTTVHAPDAIGTLDRCRAWNIDPHFYTNHRYVGALMSQKLFPRPCPHCAVPLSAAKITDEDFAASSEHRGRIGRRVHACLSAQGWDLSKVRLRGSGFEPDGKTRCGVCGGKGYKSASLVAEVILPHKEFMERIKSGAFDDAEKLWFDDLEYPRMIDHGVAKMLNGLISPEDLDDELGSFAGKDPNKAV